MFGFSFTGFSVFSTFGVLLATASGSVPGFFSVRFPLAENYFTHLLTTILDGELLMLIFFSSVHFEENRKSSDFYTILRLNNSQCDIS